MNFRANGIKFGASQEGRRPCPHCHGEADEGRRAHGHTGKDIAKYLGVSRATLYRYLTDEAA